MPVGREQTLQVRLSESECDLAERLAGEGESVQDVLRRGLHQIANKNEIATDPIDRYAQTALRFTDGVTPKSELYEHYQDWCRVADHEPVSQHRLTRDLTRRYPIDQRREYRDGKQVRCFVGVVPGGGQ